MTLPVAAANASRACRTAWRGARAARSASNTAARGATAATAALDRVMAGPDDDGDLRSNRPPARRGWRATTIGSPPTGCSTFGIADRMRVPSPAARMIDNNSAIAAPFSAADFAAFYGSNVFGNPLHRRDGKLVSGARFERVWRGLAFGEGGGSIPGSGRHVLGRLRAGRPGASPCSAAVSRP